MGKKLVKKQTGGSYGRAEAESKRDSIYNANKERSKAKLDSMMKEVEAFKKKDATVKTPVVTKKKGGQVKSKK